MTIKKLTPKKLGQTRVKTRTNPWARKKNLSKERIMPMEEKKTDAKRSAIEYEMKEKRTTV